MLTKFTDATFCLVDTIRTKRAMILNSEHSIYLQTMLMQCYDNCICHIAFVALWLSTYFAQFSKWGRIPSLMLLNLIIPQKSILNNKVQISFWPSSPNICRNWSALIGAAMCLLIFALQDKNCQLVVNTDEIFANNQF